MTWIKLPLKPLKLAIISFFASLGFLPLPIKTQFVNPVVLGQSPTSNPTGKSLFEEPPPDQGAPRGTKFAGSRGCPLAVQKQLTALVPVTKAADGAQLRWGLTTKEHPTFFFYVPYESKSIHSGKFSLRNQENQTLYETSVTLTGTPGVISVSLPATAPLLEVNKWYQSYLFIDISCAPNAPLEKDSAEAWVKREALAPGLKNELEKAKTPMHQAISYAKHGVWYETLMTLAESYRTNSKDQEWTKLLQSVGLDVAIASEPIVNCCKLEN